MAQQTSKRGVVDFNFSSPAVDFTKTVNTAGLKGQSALVTGGANGIGAGFATALAEAGAYVTIVDLHSDGEKYAKELASKGLHVQFIQADVRSWDAQLQAFKSAIEFHPTHSLDIVVTAAGLVGNSMDQWIKHNPTDSNADPHPPTTDVIDVNLTGSFYSIHLAVHYFARTIDAATSAESKQIVLVASLAGYAALPLLADYNGSKFGVRGMMKALRARPELLGEGKKRVRTNLIAPTYIRTKMIANHLGKLAEAGIPVGEVEDCVDGFLRVVTDEGVHGRAIAIAPNKGGSDMKDDLKHYDAGKGLKELIEGRLFGG
ncbi:NAD(P)-binding protein [Eremomyces bilateralis CBS 781.70]|uniref:NAD(P)-binding protein n=1 Tax=Eremomyces bilateralis CBS 781.70 TaxID=1392243 RepID=A0A6G1GCZ9_9PEZI|nr:NAD(P)-binding protein [Eremomyces bilateralis CBS 781.70]KAF1815771.1 NAD(P)-binding protein [Eremomyces bilateralis CBS 781.70]